MNDLARYVAVTGDSILGDLNNIKPRSGPLDFWVRSFSRLYTAFIVVPDVTTLRGGDDRYTVEADLVAVQSTDRSGVRILVVGCPQDGGWRIDSVDFHAPTLVAVDQAEQALDAVLAATEDGEPPLGQTVATLIEELSDRSFAEACDRAAPGRFREITGWDVADVEGLWISPSAQSFTGTADAWTISVRLGVDSDCGNQDHFLAISGALGLGVMRFDSVVREA